MVFWQKTLVVAGIALSGVVKAQSVLNELEVSREVVFRGSCDASGAVPLNEKLFAVADDEDNVIRVYDATTGGAPLLQYDLSYSSALKPERDAFGRPSPAPLDEMDIEAATTHNGLAYWITSHGRDKKGRAAPDRLRFFATQIDVKGEQISLAAPAVTDLLAALFDEPQLKRFNLPAAAAKAPKAPGGLNLEGMTASPSGNLLLGFRNPIPNDHALLVELQNPEAVLGGATAAFGPPITLDLNGRGVRGISYWSSQYLIAAGHYGEDFDPAVYSWQGIGTEPTKIHVSLPSNFNIEAFYTPDSRAEFMLLSDDGGIEVEGKACKKLKDANRKSFRGVWLNPPQHPQNNLPHIGETL